MKKLIGALILVLLTAVCFPAAIFALGGQTDVYIGVTQTSKSNVRFLVVDEEDQPLSGANIDIWANDQMEYQLLGVTNENGLFESTIPYGTYPYRVYLVGYETVEQKLILPGTEDPHVEKVILKKTVNSSESVSPDTSSDSENTSGSSSTGNGSQSSGGINGKNVKTGDDFSPTPFAVLLGASMFLVIIMVKKKKNQ